MKKTNLLICATGISLICAVFSVSCNRKDFDDIAPGFVAQFEASSTSIKEGDSVSFTNTSLGNYDAVSWHFDGGEPSESSEKNPTVTYNTSGIYDVTLTIRRGDISATAKMPKYIEVAIDETKYTSNREGQNPVNVLYFVPADIQVPVDSILENYGKCVAFAQKWYEKQMEIFGYGKKTFALFTNKKGRVRVLVVRGEKNAADYADLGDIIPEIKAYISAHPDEVGGLDAFVASNEELGYRVAQGGNIVNGEYAFIRSTDGWNYRTTGKYLNGLELFTAGRITSIMHEGGHVFGGPHFAHKASDLPNKNIMGGGSGANFWEAGNEDKVFIMEELAAYCNYSRSFNPANNGVDYIREPKMNIGSYTIHKNDITKATDYDIVFTSDMEPVHAYVNYDGNTIDGNYDNVPFGTSDITPTGNPNEYRFHVSAPYSDLFNGNNDKSKTNITASIIVIANNSRTANILQFKYTITNAPEPDNNINRTTEVREHTLSNRTGWVFTTSSWSGNTAQTADKMGDSDTLTYWHSRFPYSIATDGPHIVDVNMNASQQFKGIYLISDRDGRQFRPNKVKVEVSTDGTTYTKVMDVVLSDQPKSFIDFNTPVTAQYIRLTVSSVYTVVTAQNLLLAEVDIVK